MYKVPYCDFFIYVVKFNVADHIQINCQAHSIVSRQFVLSITPELETYLNGEPQRRALSSYQSDEIK